MRLSLEDCKEEGEGGREGGREGEGGRREEGERRKEGEEREGRGKAETQKEKVNELNDVAGSSHSPPSFSPGLLELTETEQLREATVNPPTSLLTTSAQCSQHLCPVSVSNRVSTAHSCTYSVEPV